MLRVFMMLFVLLVGACSLKLGAEKLEVDGKAGSLTI